jgi:hypothetical protein
MPDCVPSRRARPALGVIHTDKAHRDSMALDLLEPIRPTVDRDKLTILANRHYGASDFTETPDGRCRLTPPLTHDLAPLATGWAAATAPYAERVGHTIANAAAAPIRLRTRSPEPTPERKPARRSTNLHRGTKSRTAARSICSKCGTLLADPRRRLCSTCCPVHRAALAAVRAQAGLRAIEATRAEGQDPTQTSEGSPTITVEQFHAEVVPRLRSFPISALALATGLSVSACSRIRRGLLTPHPRHWDTLTSLVAD